jgi:hypothetical protein
MVKFEKRVFLEVFRTREANCPVNILFACKIILVACKIPLIIRLLIKMCKNACSGVKSVKVVKFNISAVFCPIKVPNSMIFRHQWVPTHG